MEEWKTYRIGDICESVSDTYRRGSASVVLVNTSDVLDGVCLNHTRVQNKDLKGQFKKTFKKDDILYSEIRPANKRFAYIDFDPIDYIASTKLMVIRSSDKVRPRYLYHFLKRQEMLDELQALAESRSGTFPQITFSELALFEIKLPSLETQDRIVAAIDSFEYKIALNNRINHNLEKQIQERFDRMIVSDNGLGYCQIADYVDVNPKRSIGKKVLAKCIDMSYLSTTGPFPSGWETKGYNGGMKFMNGDTIMARITPCLENGKVAFVNFLDDGEVAFGSTEYIVLHSKEGVAPEFTYFLARNRGFVDYATKNMNGSSGRQRVSGDTIEKYMIPVIDSPSLDEFSSFAAPAMEVIRNNCFESRSLASTRDALLPLLLSENPQLRK